MKRKPSDLRVWLFLMTSLALAAVGGTVAAEGDAGAQLRSLWTRARYAEAADLLAGQGGSGYEQTWWMARLTTDPTDFEELAARVSQDPSVPADAHRIAVLARAREHFAAGRYQSAVSLLQPLAEDGATPDPEARLWWGMSLQASGEARIATRALTGIDKGAPEYGLAQALLADLNLRAQRPARAREHAEAALDADPAVGAMALGVLEQLARAEGDADRSKQLTRRLAKDYPTSVELIWARAAAPAVATEVEDAGEVVAVEVDSPRRNFALQYGAFRDRALALRRIRQLEGAVKDLSLEVDREQSPALYRVVGGTFGSRAQAERARDQLASRGVSTFILTPER